MKSHDDWSTPAFAAAPAVGAVGPFPTRGFLQAVSELEGSRVVFVESATALLPLACHDGVVRFIGDSDLTDYHAPLGTGVDLLVAEAAKAAPAGTTFDLDSMPGECAAVIVDGFARAGVEATCEAHAAAAVLELPATMEAYLHAIGKKQRHELRRKRRRYEEAVGPIIHETHRGDGWAFAEFIRLHRLSGGAKSAFMTDDRARLFRALAVSPGWRIDLLRRPETEQATACLFSYEDADGLYLYNSAYDPSLAEGSPGLAIVATTIEKAIGEGLPRFDFLKGDEVYKFRLGAVERPLFRVVATT